MTNRLKIALLTGLAVAATVTTGCGKHRGGPAGDSCEAVGEHYLVVAKAEISRTEGEDRKDAEAMLSLLPKLKNQLVTECTQKKWSLEARKCVLGAKSAADAKACGKLVDPSATAAPETEPAPKPAPPAPGSAPAPSAPESAPAPAADPS